MGVKFVMLVMVVMVLGGQKKERRQHFWGSKLFRVTNFGGQNVWGVNIFKGVNILVLVVVVMMVVIVLGGQRQSII